MPPVLAQMLLHKRIVVATDFLESSHLALDYAVGFAHRYKAKLVLLHCLELSQAALEVEVEGKTSLMRRTAEQRLEALTAGVQRSGIDAEWKTCLGNPADVLPESASALNTDLLVLGTHGVHRGLNHLLIGSNTEKILLSASCPTLTVGRHVMAGVDLNLHFDEVLYVSDFTEESVAAARYALMLGRDFNTDVDVCQLLPKDTVDTPEVRHKRWEEYYERMEGVLPDNEHYWLSTVFQLNRTHATSQILQRVQSNPSALIVLGVKTQSWLGRHLKTSFAYELLSKATCPVLSIHPEAAQMPGRA